MTYKELLNAIESHLAVVHRDGGHYTGKHGLQKSIADATEKWYKLHSEREWVPVELVLPCSPKKVAVWTKSVGHATAYYCSGFWIEAFSDQPLTDVTHWHTLNTPPKQ